MVNVGPIDRTVRFVAGILLIVLPFLPPTAPWFAGLGSWTWALLVVGIVMIATAAMRFCPAYALFGMTTCGRQ
jgi:hypothetical protein